MGRLRFFIAIVLIAAGCALLVAAEAPRSQTARWVGRGSHAAHFSAARQRRAAAVDELERQNRELREENAALKRAMRSTFA